MVLLSSLLLLALSTPLQSTDAAPPAVDVPPTQTEPEQQPEAKEPPTPEHTGVKALLGNLGEDIKHLPGWPNVYIAAVGGGLAAAVHPWDQTFNAHLQSRRDSVDDIFAPGKYIGSTQVQIAFSVGAYAVGRWRDQPKVAHLGMDLLQAQILTEIIVEPLKFATQRLRPDGSDHQSFPSGHAAITFATATVIERHLGWRKAWLAYAIATYVSASRLHDNVHYPSDVIMGAAIGAIAGRTVVHHQADYWAFHAAPVGRHGMALLVTRTR
jgi:hypothetical protein